MCLPAMFANGICVDLISAAAGNLKNMAERGNTCNVSCSVAGLLPIVHWTGVVGAFIVIFASGAWPLAIGIPEPAIPTGSAIDSVFRAARPLSTSLGV